MAVVLVFAAACAGGDRHFKTVAQIVSALQTKGISCTASSAPPPAELQAFTREDGFCTLGTEDVGIATFSSTAQREHFLQAVQAGGTGIFVVGSTWIVTPNTQETASKIKSALGGKIVVSPQPRQS